MNYVLTHIPERENKPRNKGLTMVMDKGLSTREAEDLVASSGKYVDIVKLGFGTSLLCPDLENKINVYKQADIKVYFGGTLFEAFVARDQFEEYRKYLLDCEVEYVEISDGVLPIDESLKCDYIRELAKDFTVLSEVGLKTGERHLTNDEWVEKMKAERVAGAWKVIAEARESGTIGIFNKDGSANTELIKTIDEAMNADNILWEAPLKSQQVWFIKNFGPEVNLGNIATNEVIALETLRAGLRGDTLLDFLPK
ncbi:phosphosulfolactate synthase [Balneicella halophila]|uniref:Phosphosulfolactate synthase n=1 Tax=Balneicella halophila TaxID=1537566 RepID=A0A7L4UP37_BALHA|nr:phosphosulfolactate synthase [Balneicella halophila]PVX50037.1 phosphosulfolactate synthase [Balneicella halophila]